MNLRERLAALAHEQWMHWARAIMPWASPGRCARWRLRMVPYEELAEDAKNKHREWADKILGILQEVEDEKGLREEVLG